LASGDRKPLSSRLLSFSLGLNLLLLGTAGYWAARNHSDVSAATAPIPPMSRPAETSSEPTPTASAATTDSTPLRWNELESEDFPTYVANLRKAGCPRTVLRRIIGGELNELYARKAFVLVQDFHRGFWEIAARENVREYFGKTLRPQVEALCKERDALLNQLVGEAFGDMSSTPTSSASENRFTDFLSPEKQEQLHRLAERYEPRLQAVRQANLSPEEKELQLAQLCREMEGEQAEILSAEEWAEYQLRRSSAASELQQLYGVDFSETELRNIAEAIDDYHRRTASEIETDPETLEQKLRAVLGPARFADFNRARSASYRDIAEVVAAFGQPIETAAEIFDLRLKSENESDAIRVDKSRAPEEKQALLDELQEQVEQAMRTKLGTGAYQSYKAKGGRWINALGRF
jgi:hypothetical protein